MVHFTDRKFTRGGDKYEKKTVDQYSYLHVNVDKLIPIIDSSSHRGDDGGCPVRLGGIRNY